MSLQLPDRAGRQSRESRSGHFRSRAAGRLRWRTLRCSGGQVQRVQRAGPCPGDKRADAILAETSAARADLYRFAAEGDRLRPRPHRSLHHHRRHAELRAPRAQGRDARRGGRRRLRRAARAAARPSRHQPLSRRRLRLDIGGLIRASSVPACCPSPAPTRPTSCSPPLPTARASGLSWKFADRSVRRWQGWRRPTWSR